MNTNILYTTLQPDRDPRKCTLHFCLDRLDTVTYVSQSRWLESVILAKQNLSACDIIVRFIRSNTCQMNTLYTDTLLSLYITIICLFPLG